MRYRLAAAALGVLLPTTAVHAQRGTVSDFSGAGVASSAMIGHVSTQRSAAPVSPAIVSAALGEVALKLGGALNAGTIAGGGLTTSGRGVQALGRIMLTPAPAAPGDLETVARALSASSAPASDVSRLVQALTGLLLNQAVIPTGNVGESGAPAAAGMTPAPDDPSGPRATAQSAPPPALSPRGNMAVVALSPLAVDQATAAFHALVAAADSAFLSNPPEEFRAIYSTLFELRCAENAAAGITLAACAGPAYVAEQPPPVPLVNRDSIEAEERARAIAAAARARADSIAAAAARAHADSVAAVERAEATALARAALETRVLFDRDQFTLRADAKSALDAKLAILKANPGVRLRIAGNTEQRESGADDRLLGRLRAEQARSYLIAHGVSYDRIDIVNNGGAHPLCTASRESCWSENRRDDFTIVAGGAQLVMPQ